MDQHPRWRLRDAAHSFFLIVFIPSFLGNSGMMYRGTREYTMLQQLHPNLPVVEIYSIVPQVSGRANALEGHCYVDLLHFSGNFIPE